MLNLHPNVPQSSLDTKSWFERSWGEGPFTFSETLGMVLTSPDPVTAANQFHATNTTTGERVLLRDFLKDLQRPASMDHPEITNQASQMLDRILEPIC